MTKPLPNPWSLITDSWEFFIKNWNETVKISIWFLYGGLASFASRIIDGYAPELWIISMTLTLASAFFLVVGQFRLIKAVLNIEAGKTYKIGSDEVQAVIRDIPSLFWIVLLQGLIVLAGMALLILPGIYLAILLTFSSLMYFTQGKKGTQALQASRELVTGRWWPTFGRLILGAAIFGAGVGIIAAILASILTAIAGPTNVMGLSASSSRFMLYQGSMELFQSIVQTAVLPLFVGFQIKIFRALEKTR